MLCITGGTMSHMGRIVHARLDAETQRLLEGLRRGTGLTDSELIRRGIQSLPYLKARQRRIVGLGKFKSGLSDLASNKAHLRGFGRK